MVSSDLLALVDREIAEHRAALLRLEALRAALGAVVEPLPPSMGGGSPGAGAARMDALPNGSVAPATDDLSEAKRHD